MHRARLTLLVGLGVALAATPGAARAQTVVGVQNLAFGTVIPGVPVTIAPTDAVRAGQYRITGLFLATVTVTFTLPTAMNRVGGGASIPLTFLNTSGQWDPAVGATTTFNPNSPYTAFVWLGTTLVSLGGRASPAPSQLGGSYTSNIIMTVIIN
ncbi:MAG TPA: hypothetical protein VFV65_08955 [Gemmatimonadales bacterium]|nr:hypothetical protein [Gemmatimonadales bacterium]